MEFSKAEEKHNLVAMRVYLIAKTTCSYNRAPRMILLESGNVFAPWGIFAFRAVTAVKKKLKCDKVLGAWWTPDKYAGGLVTVRTKQSKI